MDEEGAGSSDTYRELTPKRRDERREVATFFPRDAQERISWSMQGPSRRRLICWISDSHGFDTASIEHRSILKGPLAPSPLLVTLWPGEVP